MTLRNYLDCFRNALEKFDVFGLSEQIDIKEEIRPGKQAVINSKVLLVNSTNLHIRAYIDAKYKIDVVSYAFQYQKHGQQLCIMFQEFPWTNNLAVEGREYIKQNLDKMLKMLFSPHEN